MVVAAFRVAAANGAQYGGQAGVTNRATMRQDLGADQYTNITGSGVLRGPLTIITQFGGAGGIGGQNYAGGGGTDGGYGGGGYGGGGLGGAGQSGVGGLHPPGVSLNQAYNTLVGLPSQQGQLGGGFGQGGGAATLWLRRLWRLPWLWWRLWLPRWRIRLPCGGKFGGFGNCAMATD